MRRITIRKSKGFKLAAKNIGAARAYAVGRSNALKRALKRPRVPKVKRIPNAAKAWRKARVTSEKRLVGNKLLKSYVRTARSFTSGGYAGGRSGKRAYQKRGIPLRRRSW